MSEVVATVYSSQYSSKVRMLCEDYLNEVSGIKFSHMAIELISSLYYNCSIIDECSERLEYNFNKSSLYREIFHTRKKLRDEYILLEGVLKEDLKLWCSCGFNNEGLCNGWGIDNNYGVLGVINNNIKSGVSNNRSESGVTGNSRNQEYKGSKIDYSSAIKKYNETIDSYLAKFVGLSSVELNKKRRNYLKRLKCREKKRMRQSGDVSDVSQDND